jgi:hypothetical protein
MIDKILTDINPKFAKIIDYDLNGFDHTRLWNCDLLEFDAINNVVLESCGGRLVPDMIGNPLSWLICSKRLGDILKRNDPDGIQLLECQILSRASNSLTSHYVVNVLNFMDAINLEESDYEEENGVIDMIYEWVFNAERVPSRKMLFREKSFIYSIFSTRSMSLDFMGMTGMAFEACSVRY